MDYEKMWMLLKSSITNNFSPDDILKEISRLECLLIMNKMEIDEINGKNKPKEKIGF